MTHLRCVPLLAALLLPATLHAHAVGDEVSVNTTPALATDGTPTRTFSNTLSGTIDVVEDRVGIDLLYSVLKDESGTLRHFMLLGGDFTPTEHWNFSLTLSGTPIKHEGVYGLDSSVYDPCLNVEKLGDGATAVKAKAACAKGKKAPTGVLQTRDGTVGAAVSAGYDTAGETDFETSADVTLGLTHYSLDQTPAIQIGNTVIPVCSKKLADCKTSRGQAFLDTLNQFKISVGVTETLFESTDVGLRGNLYLFDQDPTSAGEHISRLGQPVGAGIPIAPLVFEIRPSVNHRFGKLFAANLSFTRGKYVGEDGNENILAAKVTFKPVHAFRTWLSLALQRDSSTDPTVQGAASNYLSLGIEFRF